MPHCWVVWPGGVYGLVEQRVGAFVRLKVGKCPKIVPWDGATNAWMIGCWDGDLLTKLKFGNGGGQVIITPVEEVGENETWGVKNAMEKCKNAQNAKESLPE